MLASKIHRGREKGFFAKTCPTLRSIWNVPAMVLSEMLLSLGPIFFRKPFINLDMKVFVLIFPVFSKCRLEMCAALLGRETLMGAQEYSYFERSVDADCV